MVLGLVMRRQRRALRRALRTRCVAVSTLDFRLIADEAFDLSPRGMLIECDPGVGLGDVIRVSFEVPGTGWFEADGEVARIVRGKREHDPGYCAGLSFRGLHRGSAGALLASLAGLPPPVPRRPLRIDYAESVRRIATARSGPPALREPFGDALKRWPLLYP